MWLFEWLASLRLSHRGEFKVESSPNTSGEKTDWMLVEQVEMDICYLYHESADWGGIMGDLYHGNRPYWEYLNWKLLDEYQTRFVRDGCLVMIFVMCDQYIMGAGFGIEDHVSECLRALSSVEPEDEQTARLVKSVKMALEAVQGKSVPEDELNESYQWIFRTYVGGYFQGMVEKLVANPYYNEFRTSQTKRQQE